MLIDVTLQVSGIDIDDAHTGQILGEQFPALLWQGENACLTVTFEVDDAKAPAEVLDVVRRLESAFPSFIVTRVDRDLVSTTDIATRVGVSREAARKWGKEIGFPAAFATFGGNHNAWLWSEVLAWLDDARGIRLDERVANEAVMVQIDNCLMRNPDATSVHWETISRQTKAPVIWMDAWKSDRRTPSVFATEPVSIVMFEAAR